jgi:hypothetical protein
MQLSLMSAKSPADPDAVNVLPAEVTWCARLEARTNLRHASWSFRNDECVLGPRPCPNCDLCQRVVDALNRPSH